MLPIPSRILTSAATLNATAETDQWQEMTGGQEIALSRVFLQRGSGIKATSVNMEVQPIAELYYDCRLSRPRGLDWIALKRTAEARGASLIVKHAGQTYTVTYVDELQDERGRPHHYRMEMI